MIKDKMMGQCDMISSGQWVGEPPKDSKPISDDNDLNLEGEAKDQDDDLDSIGEAADAQVDKSGKGMLWVDVAFTVEVENGKAPASEGTPDPESDDLPPTAAKKTSFEGVVCVRRDPSKLDAKKEPMNVVIIKRTTRLKTWAEREAWNGVANRMLDLLAFMMAPPSEQKEVAAKKPATKPSATGVVQAVLKNVPGIGCCSSGAEAAAATAAAK